MLAWWKTKQTPKTPVWNSECAIILCDCVSVIMSNTLFSCCCCCVWLCAQPCWLLADNDIRGRVFVDLVAEEIPTVLRVSGLCVFLGLHAWLRQLFHSAAGPSTLPSPRLWPTPSSPLRPALHLIRAALAEPSTELLRAAPRQQYSLLPIRAHTIYMWKPRVLSSVHWSNRTTAKWVCAGTYVRGYDGAARQ